VFAEREARFLGEAVAAVVGDPAAIVVLDLQQFLSPGKPLGASRNPKKR